MSRHGRLCQNASMNAALELVGDRRRRGRAGRRARRRRALGERLGRHAPRLACAAPPASDACRRSGSACPGRGTAGRAARRSARCSRRPATRRSSASAWLVVVPPCTWWNEPSPRIVTTLTSGDDAEPLVELEVGVAAARHREALVEAADLLEQRAGHEDAVALPQAVEPVAVADEVADLEQPVAVARPLDLLEQLVLVRLVVAVVHRVALLAGPDVPLLRRDDRRRVGRAARPARSAARPA